MTVQAKVRCNANTPPQWGGQAEPSTDTRVVRFAPVYDDNPESPNHEWSKYTPAGYIELTITNPAAFERFEAGKTYLLTFEESD